MYGALKDEGIISRVMSAEPVAASDVEEEEDKAPVRPVARKRWPDGMPPVSSVLRKVKGRLSTTSARYSKKYWLSPVKTKSSLQSWAFSSVEVFTYPTRIPYRFPIALYCSYSSLSLV